MRVAVKVIQVVVGLLFVVSGLVKANDPVGLGYKMQEFFELWSASFDPQSMATQIFSVLHEAALGLSLFMITLEIFAGVALLIGWQKKFVLWLLLLLIIFFTFLTGYAFLSGKFTNCGCFGDCLPITPLTSFLKDIVLLVLIIVLLAGQRHIQPAFSGAARTAVLVASVLLSLGLQWYVLHYLPLADCLPFKKGNYLPAAMKPPPGAVPDSFAIRFVYEKGGKQFEFAPDDLPADFTTYKFIDRKQTLVRKGNADAPIKGFSLTNEGRDSITGNTIDSAEIILSQPLALLVFALKVDEPSWLQDLKAVVRNASMAGVPVYVVSPTISDASAAFADAGIGGVHFFTTDFTVIRTVARTNPTLLLVKDGTVIKKWGKHEFRKAAGYLSGATD